jgi:hypothetical protein
MGGKRVPEPKVRREISRHVPLSSQYLEIGTSGTLQPGSCVVALIWNISSQDSNTHLLPQILRHQKEFSFAHQGRNLTMLEVSPTSKQACYQMTGRSPPSIEHLNRGIPDMLQLSSVLSPPQLLCRHWIWFCKGTESQLKIYSIATFGTVVDSSMIFVNLRLKLH